jgi:hypothetical protein
MKKLIAAALVAATLGTGVLAASPASAGSNPGCITRTEFRRIKNGMTLTQVKRIVGSGGRVSLSSPPIVIRDFRTCTRFHVSSVTFWSGRVDGKLYI